jgi:2-polyprenyl-3-methyl-5-hydroxy-6-metoxy-1,4-benzoquinol methylase
MSKAMKCPLCDSIEIESYIQHLDWSIQTCKSCTNAWTQPYPDAIEYDKTSFSPVSLSDGKQDKVITVNDLPGQWRKSVAMQTSLLRRYLSQGSKILEIGCGEGILLGELQNAGFNVKGIEPSLRATTKARKKGLDVLNDYFPSQKISDIFDCVILSHVLEHLSNPLETLSQIAKLAPSGYVFFVQTNYRGIIPRIYKERWYGWSTHEHFWHFTPQGLTEISRDFGYQVLSYEFSSLVHEDGKLVKILSKLGELLPPAHDQFHILYKVNG